MGPFMLSLFANGRGIKVLGDRKVEFSDSSDRDRPGDDPEYDHVRRDWEFEKKPWIFGGGVGVRFRWLPE